MTEGERFRGYVVERLIGKGGYGAVYKVRHEVLDTPFALKVLDPEVRCMTPDTMRSAGYTTSSWTSCRAAPFARP